MKDHIPDTLADDANNHETRADILREMREQANEPTIESLGEVFPPVGVEDVKDWADRIEAAAKRESEAAQSARDTRDAMDYAATAARTFAGVDLAKGEPTYTCVENAPGNAAAMREALVAVKAGVYTSGYGNRFAVANVNLGGYRFHIHVDHSGFYPHIKVKDQEEVLNRVMDELVDCINKGSAALFAPARNCDVVLIENLAKRNIADIVWAAFRETHPKAYLDVPGLLQCINWLFVKAEGDDHAKND